MSGIIPLCRVAVHSVWLEFMIDGEGDYFVHAHGQVIKAANQRLKPVRTVELKFGNYDALITGLHVLGVHASATILKDREAIEAIKTLVAHSTATGAHLIADITADGPGTERAQGKAHSWTACDARFDVLSTAPVATGTPTDLEDSANIRAELEPPRLSSGNSATETITLSGKVTTLSGVEIADFDRLTLHLDPGASEGRLRLDGASAELTWPTPATDLPHIHALLERAHPSGRRLLDVDLGTKALDEAGTLWPVTDVSVLVQMLGD